MDVAAAGLLTLIQADDELGRTRLATLALKVNDATILPAFKAKSTVSTVIYKRHEGNRFRDSPRGLGWARASVMMATPANSTVD
jgi:hypothetical protein